MLTRRSLIGQASALGLTGLLPTAAHASKTGAFTPDWTSLVAGYRTPDWFRDAKFGIWSHWGPQCVPEFGDWYGRLMYVQGNRAYEHHVKTYGHPSRFGFMEFNNRWKAERWEPEALIALYRKAGARYFVAMANHHDNLDMFDSAHHPWNTLNVGPRRDIIGTWEKLARREGLRFGVSNHGAHAWHWWQTAYGYDAEGPMAGVRYDAFRLTKADGKGTWWEGLDPQELYTGAHMLVPDGLTSIEAMDAWHTANDGRWMEYGPSRGPFVAKWLARQKDLVEKYRPDLVYFDDSGLPFGSAGLDAAAHYYNSAVGWRGQADVVLTAKKLLPVQRRGIVEDVERGFAEDIMPEPWQTCTCIGSWHYDRPLYERRGYKSAKSVVQRLCDIVSKNGNLLLSIPQRGDGSIDDQEETILGDIANWMQTNGAAIYGTRPWRIFGEGPTKVDAGIMNEGGAKPFTPADMRFTAGGEGGADTLNAFFLERPQGEARIAALGSRALPNARIERVELLGHGPVAFRRTTAALIVQMPDGAGFVPCVRISGERLV
jgi:alpha-L-fucosidase